MACGGCGHKYFRPPRTRNVGGVTRATVRNSTPRDWKQGRVTSIAEVTPTATPPNTTVDTSKTLDEKPQES